MQVEGEENLFFHNQFVFSNEGYTWPRAITLHSNEVYEGVQSDKRGNKAVNMNVQLWPKIHQIMWY